MNETIKFTNPQIPLHHQIANYFMSKVRSGELGADERLPPEEVLSRQFGVSRSTIRHALSFLVNEGIISRQRGVGTFLTEKTTRFRVEKFTGVGWDIFLGSQRARTAVLEKKKVISPKGVSEFLGLQDGEEVFRFKRVRFVDGGPLSFIINHVKKEIGEKVTKGDLMKKTMLETLKYKLELPLAGIKHVVEVERADSETASHLKINLFDPVLAIETLVFLDNGTPIELVKTYFREDRYKFTVYLDRVF